MGDTPYTTTQSGIPVASDEHSLTAGSNGVTVLHDRAVEHELFARLQRQLEWQIPGSPILVPDRNDPARLME